MFLSAFARYWAPVAAWTAAPLFNGWLLPLALLLPQLLVTIFFFYWPAGEAIWSSMTTTDPFGQGSVFVGLDNFTDLFTDPLYLATILRTVFFCLAVSVLAMGDGPRTGRLRRPRNPRPRHLSHAADLALRHRAGHVRGAVAVHAQSASRIARPLAERARHAWDYYLNGSQAMLMVILASAWKQVSYNFIFFLAGLQSIPRAVTEAARMDGARGWHRFRTITFPLLAPTTFFLLVVNLVYAAFDTFGTIFALTQGGPGKDTETLVIKVYRDGMINQDIGGSSAQSVVLMARVIAMTARAVPLHGPPDQRMTRAMTTSDHAIVPRDHHVCRTTSACWPGMTDSPGAGLAPAEMDRLIAAAEAAADVAGAVVRPFFRAGVAPT